MIKSKEDYLYYLECDAMALGRKSIKTNLINDDIWKFQKSLRMLEYYNNCKKSLVYKPVKLVLKYHFYRKSLKIGVEIPTNVFGPGLAIVHKGTIIINPAAKIGANCRIHVGVNIGAIPKSPKSVPQIGDNCYIAPGVKLFGDIKIGDNVAIGANSVVNKTFKDGNVTIAGVPAKIINNIGSIGMFPLATEFIRIGDKKK